MSDLRDMSAEAIAFCEQHKSGYGTMSEVCNFALRRLGASVRELADEIVDYLNDNGTELPGTKLREGVTDILARKHIAAARVSPGVIEEIIRDVAELPDRDSPKDWPEAMLVTSEELQLILERNLEPAPPEAEQEERRDG